MRVLHLIDGTGGPNGGGTLERAGAACALLGRGAGGDQQTIVVGGSVARGRARALGAPAVRAIAAAIGKPLLAWRALGRAWAGAGADIVHCWGAEMLELSRLALPGRVGRVAVLDRPPRGTLALAGDWLGAPLSRAVLLCPGWARASLEAHYSGLQVAAVPPPPAPMLREPGPRGEEARRRLGVEDGELALLCLNRRSDAVRLVYLLGLMACAGVRVVGVVPRGAVAQGARGRRLRKGSRLAIRVVHSDEPAPALAPGCDLGVWEPGGPGATSNRPVIPGEATWDVAPALAAGLPVVAPRGSIDARILPPELEGRCLAVNGTLPELARAVLALASDPEGLGAAARSARAHAAAADWAGGFVRVVEGAWERAAAGAGAAASRREEARPVGAWGVQGAAS